MLALWQVTLLRATELPAQPRQDRRGHTLAQARADAGTAQARADAGVTTPASAVSRVDVIVMVGSNGAGGVAANLRPYAQLTRPPFSAYRQIDRVSQSTLPLSAQTPATLSIPNSGTVQISLDPEPRDGRVTAVVVITLGGRTHRTQFAARAGVPFFLAHSTGVDGALILRFVLN